MGVVQVGTWEGGVGQEDTCPEEGEEEDVVHAHGGRGLVGIQDKEEVGVVGRGR